MKSKSLHLQVCANGTLSARNAIAAGVDSIELCEHLEVDGLTPSAEVIKQVKEFSSIPVHVLIRPRAGDFCYSREEFRLMKDQIEHCLRLNVDTVVVGMLTPEGLVDSIRCKQLVEMMKPRSITFHRAFDKAKNPFHALERIIALGFDRILTSGQKENCLEGSKTIAGLIKQARGRISIMAGGGITEENIAEVVKRTGINEFHFSAKKKLADGSFVSDLNRIREINQIAEKTFYAQ